jgi:multicomponent Na+:H+ antiporter subunit C
MTVFELYAGTGVALFAFGLLRLALPAGLVRRLVALNLMGNGVFLVLVATAWRNADPDPDPVPHALVLTGIVVAVSVTALALVLARNVHARRGRIELEHDE